MTNDKNPPTRSVRLTVSLEPRVLYRAFAICFALCCSGAILRDVFRYGVNVPFWDEWDLVRSLARIDGGQMSWLQAPLVRLGEHRNGLVLLLSAAWWHIAGVDGIGAMVLNWLCASLLCVLGLQVARRASPAGSSIPYTVFAACAFFVFNPAAYQMWLWGLPNVYVLVVLLLLSAVMVAQSGQSERTKVLTAGVSAFLACFLLGSGLLLWVLLPPIVACHAKPGVFRRERVASAVALLLMVASLGLLFSGMPPSQGDSSASGSGLVSIGSFFFAYTGNLVSLATASTSPALAEWTGLAICAFFIVTLTLAIKRFRTSPQWPMVTIWGSLGVYSLLGGLAVAVSRHGFGIAYAVDSSRYVLTSSFLPIACVALGCVVLADAAADLPRRLFFYSCMLCALAGLLIAGGCFRLLQTDRSHALMEHTHFWQTTGKVAMAGVNLIELPQYRNIFSTDRGLEFKACANFLNSRRWLDPGLWDRAFIDRLANARAPESAYGSIEQASIAGRTLHLSGWAYLVERRQRSHAILVAAVSAQGTASLLSVLFPSIPRADMMERTGFPDALAGWTGDIDLGPSVSSGNVVRCFAYDADTGQTHLLAGSVTAP